MIVFDVGWVRDANYLPNLEKADGMNLGLRMWLCESDDNPDSTYKSRG
jgi:hypothetical protein